MTTTKLFPAVAMIALAAGLITGCQLRAGAAPTATITPLSPVTPVPPTLTPVPPTDTTLPPTYTPTVTPPPTATPFPWSSGVISPSNATRVAELIAWGKGVPINTLSAAGGKVVVLQTPEGFYLQDRQSMALINFIPCPARLDSPGNFALSPDGNTLAVNLTDGSVQLWRVEDGKMLFTLVHQAEVPKYPDQYFSLDDFVRAWSLVFSPDSQMLAAGYGDNKIELWRVSDGTSAGILYQDISPFPNQLGFSYDGKYLASSNGMNVGIWDLAKPGLVNRITNAGEVSERPFSPDDKTLVTSGLSDVGMIKTWSLPNGEILARYATDLAGQVVRAVYSRDGKYLFISGSLGKHQVRSSYDGRLIDNPPVTPEPSAFISLDAATLNTAGYFSNFLGGAFSAEREILLWGLEDSVYLWRLPEGKLELIDARPDPDMALVGSLDGKTLILCQGQQITSIDTASLVVHPLGSICINGVIYAVSNAVVARGVNEMLEVLSLSDGSNLHVMSGHTDKLNNLAFSPDGKYLASAEYNFRHYIQVRVWKLEPASGLVSFADVPYGANPMAFSRDDSFFVFAQARSGVIRVVHLPDGTVVKLVSLKITPTSLAFSPDGSLLAVGDGGGLIHLVETSGWQEVAALQGHKAEVRALDFSTDGKNLLSVSQDGTVRLWGIPAP